MRRLTNYKRLLIDIYLCVIGYCSNIKNMQAQGISGVRRNTGSIILSLCFLTSCFVLLSVSSTFAQTGVVTGTISSAETGEPLPGANIVVEGTNLGTSTDREGEYRFNVPVGDQTIIVSFLGFQENRVTVTVQAGQITELNLTLQSEAIAGDEILVTGLRRGQVRSIGQKREAVNIIDAISADEVGRLPDLNVAESAQRIPGLTIRTDRGEGRFVSIRGTSPNRSNVTFNGQSMASSAGTRATALDLVPSEMVSSIEVTKAVTPDMDANALGGSVNISTLTAFDREGSFLSASVSGMQHQQVIDYGENNFPYRASLTTGTRFGANDAWGIVLSGTASRRDFKSSQAHTDEWVREGGFVVPEEFELDVENNDRKRYSVNANLDFRPNPGTELFMRLHHSRRNESFENAEYIFDGQSVEPESATRGRNIFEGELDIPITDINERLYALTVGGEQALSDNVQWDLRGTYSRGERQRETFQPEWGFDQDFVLLYDLGGEKPTYSLEDQAAVFNAANYEFDEMDIEFEDLVENTWQLGTDLQWDFQSGSNTTGFIKAGGQFQLRDKDIDENENPWAAGSEKFTVADGFAIDPPGAFSGGAIGGESVMPVNGGTRTFLDFWEQNQNRAELFSLDPVESREEEVERDAVVTEDVYAGYLMGNFRTGGLTATGGVRIEATQTSSDRSRFIDDPTLDEYQITPQSESNSYTNVLPSLHLVYQLSDNVQVRGAWSNTLGRPDYDELSAFQDIEFEMSDEGPWEASIDQGNPDLKPFLAMNLDVSLEIYSGPGDLISVGAFYKDIKDPIYNFDITERDVEGRDLGLDVQGVPGFEDRFFSQVNISQLRNADEGSIWGVEASFMQIFDFLPGILSGLGLNANAAIIGSEVTVPGRENDDLPFFDQSDFVYNIIPYYQVGNLELRVAMNYQSEYLSNVGSEPLEDEYGDERFTIDLSGRYGFMDGRLQLNAYVRNLTNEAEREFQGRRSRNIGHVLTGRTFELGLTVNL
ncbi:MAG: TonB-dependent receptor [Balneolaceae bacterium]